MTQAKRPHTAIINCMVEVHDLLDTGECSGNMVPVDMLAEYKIRPAFLLSVSGFDRDDCLKKLKTKIEEFNNG